MIFIDACKRKDTPYTPIWMMRQAGRYLSEYKEVRAKVGNFLDLCKNAEFASVVTLQPIDILDCDAAILFSDILVVPLEMGLELDFIKNEGPKFRQCIRNENDLKMLHNEAYKKLAYVYDTISLTRSKLAKDKALIGFCGKIGSEHYKKASLAAKNYIYDNLGATEKIITIIMKK